AGGTLQCFERMDWDLEPVGAKPSRQRDGTPCHVHREPRFGNDPIAFAIDADEEVLFFAMGFGRGPDVPGRGCAKEFFVAFERASIPILEFMFFGCTAFGRVMVKW